jgi:choline-sulfatase
VLASRGVRFENSFVSQSICWVSRTSILTGLTGRSYGTPDDPDLTRADVAETLYTDLLRDHGYRTGFFGKWHARMPKGHRPADHFDEFENIFRNPFFKKLADGSLRHETDLIVDRGIDFVERLPGTSRLYCISGSTHAMPRTVTGVPACISPGRRAPMGCTRTWRCPHRG